jgi:NAD+ diphosphatase
MVEGLGFIGGTLDRADRVRNDPALLAAALADPAARLLRLDRLSPCLDAEGGLLTAPVPADLGARDVILLGAEDEGPLFVRLDLADLPHGAAFAPDVWRAAGLMSAADLAHFGAARSLLDWHARHGFCANCGQPTRVAKAGWARQCDACGTEHYPRVDPVVIMLAEHEGRVLVGRQPRYPAGRYSALAGFVEPGEAIEEAVARELWEEAGIRVRAVTYALSQPWPFPSSLMIGCFAQTDDPALTIDKTELDDAIWVDRAGVAAAMAADPGAPFLPPPPLAIAHHLLRLWLTAPSERGRARLG